MITPDLEKEWDAFRQLHMPHPTAGDNRLSFMAGAYTVLALISRGADSDQAADEAAEMFADLMQDVSAVLSVETVKRRRFKVESN